MRFIRITERLSWISGSLQFHHSPGRGNSVVILFQKIATRTQNAILKVFVNVDTFRIAFVQNFLHLVELRADDVSVSVVEVPLIVGVILKNFHSFCDSLVNLPQAKMKRETQTLMAVER